MTRSRYRGALHFVGLAIAAALLPAPAGAAEPEARALTHDGIERTYLRYIPDRLAAGAHGAPLLIVLHGGRGSGRQMMRYSGFNRVADRAGFVVLYPDGLGRHWSDGRAVNVDATAGADDVGFLRALIDRETGKGRADARRVFVAGISNGGFMSLRLACEASGWIAGVAAVTAQFTDYLSTRCRPAGPVGVLLMNGTEDPLVPYDGGSVGLRFRPRGRVISTAATLAFWAWRNGCTGDPAKRTLPDRDPRDGTRIERWAWAPCAERGPVMLYRVIGGGHTWPGKRPYLPERWIGRTSRDADGSALIWAFFEALPARPLR